MEAREIRYIMIEDKQGPEGEFVFTLNIPLNASWDMAHQATANFCAAIKELQEKNRVALEEAAAKQADLASQGYAGQEAAPAQEAEVVA